MVTEETQNRSEQSILFDELVLYAKRPLWLQKLIPASADDCFPILLSYTYSSLKRLEEIVVDFPGHQLTIRRDVCTDEVFLMVQSRGEVALATCRLSEQFRKAPHTTLQAIVKTIDRFSFILLIKYWFKCIF